MTTVLRGRVLTEDGMLADAAVGFSGERLAFVGPSDRPATVDLPDDVLLVPGLVDTHCHGGGGGEFGPDADIGRRAAAHHHRAGTTTLLGSLVSAEPEQLIAGMEACALLAAEGVLAGVHTEGPFLADERRGAQDPRALRGVDLDLVDRLAAAGRGHWRTMTFAPELEGADALVGRLAHHRVRPAVGHTAGTAATTWDAVRAVREATGSGPTVTHLFNGMAPFHHRSPGPAGTALAAAASDEAVVELVADGVHLADETVAMVARVAPESAVVLVTDAMAACGMDDGIYRLGRLRVEVTGGAARLTEDGALAGGVATLLELVARCVATGAMTLERAVAAASWVPARTYGLTDVGRLAPGCYADVLAVDCALRPLAVWRRGREVLPVAR